MSDLISRSAVLKQFETFVFTDEKEKKRIGDIIEYCVNYAPIVFDKEKVVKELEKKKSNYNAETEAFWNFREAIEIVKRGGIDGN